VGAPSDTRHVSHNMKAASTTVVEVVARYIAAVHHPDHGAPV
jgi:hypothetical protein